MEGWRLWPRRVRPRRRWMLDGLSGRRPGGVVMTTISVSASRRPNRFDGVLALRSSFNQREFVAEMPRRVLRERLIHSLAEMTTGGLPIRGAEAFECEGQQGLSRCRLGLWSGCGFRAPASGVPNPAANQQRCFTTTPLIFPKIIRPQRSARPCDDSARCVRRGRARVDDTIVRRRDTDAWKASFPSLMI